jgi:tetratricopeptide (TPR) repeat protein
MYRRSSTILLIFLAVVIVISTSGCEKLKVSRLTANHHFARANFFYADKHYRDAIKEYELALTHNPQLVDAYRYLGESYKQFFKAGVDTEENMENANKAIDALTRALEIDPKNRDVLHSLGEMYNRMRYFGEAEILYLRIVQLDPTNLNNYNVLADFYSGYSGENQQLMTKAEQMYFRRVELDPESADSYAFVAQFYKNRIKYEGKIASQLFDRSNKFNILRAKLEPDNYIPWFAIGVNRFDKAFTLRNALTYDEKDKLGIEAKAALLKAIELEPDAPNPYIYMSILYLNVFAKIFPEKEEIMLAEVQRWRNRYDDKKKKQLEKERLEQELRGMR